MKRAYVLGAGGQIGRAVVEALRGWHVTVATSRDIDRDDSEALRRATAGSDVVIDVIAFGPEHARQLLSLDAGAIVAVSSASVYGLHLRHPEPIVESTPRLQPGDDDYTARKVAMEDVLLGQDAVPATVLRPCAVHGPYSRSPREWFFLKRALDGRAAVPVAYAGRSVFHTTAAVNLAELIRLAAERPQTRAFNAADPDPPQVAEIARLIAPELEVVPVEGEPPGSTTPWSAEHAFVLDMAAAERDLGYRPVATYEQALPRLLEWMHAATTGRDWREAFPGLAKYPEDLFDYAAEDALLATLRRS